MLCVIKICMVFFKLISLDGAALFELNYLYAAVIQVRLKEY